MEGKAYKDLFEDVIYQPVTLQELEEFLEKHNPAAWNRIQQERIDLARRSAPLPLSRSVVLLCGFPPPTPRPASPFVSMAQLVEGESDALKNAGSDPGEAQDGFNWWL